MLKNVPFLVSIGVDRAEVWPEKKLAYSSIVFSVNRQRARRGGRRAAAAAPRLQSRPKFGAIFGRSVLGRKEGIPDHSSKTKGTEGCSSDPCEKEREEKCYFKVTLAKRHVKKIWRERS